jgi:hypothetical protein
MYKFSADYIIKPFQKWAVSKYGVQPSLCINREHLKCAVINRVKDSPALFSRHKHKSLCHSDSGNLFHTKIFFIKKACNKFKNF